MMGKKIDKEFGSAANLIKNAENVGTELGRGDSTMSDKRKTFSRTQSRASEFETVKRTSKIIQCAKKITKSLANVNMWANTDILENYILQK